MLKRLAYSPSLLLFATLFILPWTLNSADPIAPLSAPLTLGEPELTIGWKGWFTLVLVAITFVVLIWEIFPADMVMLVGAVTLLLAGVNTPAMFLEGFARDIILTLIALFVVAHSMDRCGLLTALSQWALPKTNNRTKQLFGIMIPVSISSAFLNNTPIVLMLTGTIRRWARKKQLYPSKFLIPLSFAAILGGTCTLIGTSGNLIVDSLLRGSAPEAGLQFFELAKIGIPITVVGLIYIAFVGHRLLPEREDPAALLSSETRDFFGEFIIEEDCPVVGNTVRQASRKFFIGLLLVEIERGNFVIDSPSPNEKIHQGDRLVLTGDIGNIAAIHGIEGIRSAADPHFELDLDAPHFSEVVVSITSTLIGKTLKQTDFRDTFGASVVAIYRQGWRVPGNVSDVVLHPGDTLVLLSSEQWRGGELSPNEFYLISQNEPIAPFVMWRAIFVLMILVAMVVAASAGVPMMFAASIAAVVLLLSRSLSLNEARKGIGWSLLVLIGSSFSYGMAVNSTGLANEAAHGVLAVVGSEPHWLILGIFLITMITTEVITNSAAVLLIFPIALQAMHLAGYYSVDATKATGITVALAASCSFLSPIGYQTNTIVYGPGGYRFLDYMRAGFFLNMVVATATTLLVPHFWPLH